MAVDWIDSVRLSLRSAFTNYLNIFYMCQEGNDYSKFRQLVAFKIGYQYLKFCFVLCGPSGYESLNNLNFANLNSSPGYVIPTKPLKPMAPIPSRNVPKSDVRYSLDVGIAKNPFKSDMFQNAKDQSILKLSGFCLQSSNGLCLKLMKIYITICIAL